MQGIAADGLIDPLAGRKTIFLPSSLDLPFVSARAGPILR
jgi:hypothetical protein